MSAAHEPEPPRRSRLSAPPAVAALVWVCGFGALLAFHLGMRPVPAQLGLFDFASATWGDGLALPIMAGFLTYAVTLLPAAQAERAAAVGMGVLGALLGAGTQVGWLLDDAPRTNWTFPRPHHFNAAGWYHACFLTLMSAAAAVLWTVALLRLARRRDVRKARRAAATGRCRAAAAGDRTRAVIAVGVAFMAAATFAALLAVDAAPNPRTASSVVTAVAIAAGGILLMIGLAITAAYAARHRSSAAGSTSPRSR